MSTWSRFYIFAAIVVVLGSGNVFAEKDRGILDFDVVFGGDFAWGGDELAKVPIVKITQSPFTGTNTSEEGTADLFAGSGVLVYVGCNIISTKHPIGVISTIGILSDWADIEDYSFSFNRTPLEVIPYFWRGRIRLGAGPTYHLSPKLNVGPEKLSFDSSMGVVLQAEVRLYSDWWGQTWVKLRETLISYSIDTPDGTSIINGNGTALGLYWAF